MNRKDSKSLIVVAGNDMSPAIEMGETLEVEDVSPSQIRTGDVILFRRYVSIAHRVVGLLRDRSGYFFFTHGDKCIDLDSPVHQRYVVGRVVGKSVPMIFPTRSRILFAFLLLWYMPVSRLLNNPVVRRFHQTMLHVVSKFATPRKRA
jgi:signal peptidase I